MAKIDRYVFFFLFDDKNLPRVTCCVGYSDKVIDNIFISTAICGINEKPDAMVGLAIAKKRIDRMAKNDVKRTETNEISNIEALMALGSCGKFLSGKTSCRSTKSDELWIQDKYYNLSDNTIKTCDWPNEFKIVMHIVKDIPTDSRFIVFVKPIKSHEGRTIIDTDFTRVQIAVSNYFEKDCNSKRREAQHGCFAAKSFDSIKMDKNGKISIRSKEVADAIRQYRIAKERLEKLMTSEKIYEAL